MYIYICISLYIYILYIYIYMYIYYVDVCDVCIHGVDLAPHHDVSIGQVLKRLPFCHSPLEVLGVY